MKTALGTPDRGDDRPYGVDYYTSIRPMKDGENQSTLFPVTAPKIASYGSNIEKGDKDKTAPTEDIHQKAHEPRMIRGFLPTAPEGASRNHTRMPAPDLISEDAKAARMGQGQLWRHAKDGNY